MNESTPAYWIWSADHQVHGPLELPALVKWVKSARVTADTWLFADTKNAWIPAVQLPELQVFFRPRETTASGTMILRREELKSAFPYGTEVLRCIKFFAEWPEARLTSMVKYMEIIGCPAFDYVVRKGDHGDAMFVVLEGELRVRVLIDKKESTLTTLQRGDFFGEISLLDEGPRSADVVANQDSTLLKMTSASFRKLTEEAPELAAPFLLSLCRSVVGRMRVLSKQYQDSIHLSRLIGETQ